MQSTTGWIAALAASAGLALAGCGGGATTPAAGGTGAAGSGGTTGSGAGAATTAGMTQYKCSKGDCSKTKEGKTGEAAPQC